MLQIFSVTEGANKKPNRLTRRLMKAARVVYTPPRTLFRTIPLTIENKMHYETFDCRDVQIRSTFHHAKCLHFILPRDSIFL